MLVEEHVGGHWGVKRAVGVKCDHELGRRVQVEIQVAQLVEELALKARHVLIHEAVRELGCVKVARQHRVDRRVVIGVKDNDDIAEERGPKSLERRVKVLQLEAREAAGAQVNINPWRRSAPCRSHRTLKR